MSMMKKTDAAFKWLETALANGFKGWHTLDNDSDIDNLRKDPRFASLVSRYRSS